MINSRLQKHLKCDSLLLEFSAMPLPQTLRTFYQNCLDEGIRLKKSPIAPNQLNFYYATTKPICLLEVPLEQCSFEFVVTLLYFNQEGRESQLSYPLHRTILLREGLLTKYYLLYDVEETLSERESLQYLCQLSATVINCRSASQTDYYEQHAGQIRGGEGESVAQRWWKNTLFQVPGLGREKCLAIAEAFPSYQSVLRDSEGQQQLKNVWVQRGTKPVKLGKVLANRIYKCIMSLDANDSIFEV